MHQNTQLTEKLLQTSEQMTAAAKTFSKKAVDLQEERKATAYLTCSRKCRTQLLFGAIPGLVVVYVILSYGLCGDMSLMQGCTGKDPPPEA